MNLELVGSMKITIEKLTWTLNRWSGCCLDDLYRENDLS